jgi:chemotaxis protein CheD
MVRMGELEVANDEGAVLATIGLGSCIGLTLLEAGRPVIGLAHIVLPSSNGDPGETPAKFADTAVPALLERMSKIGAIKARLEAILVGGAQMFSFGSSPALDMGRRNEEATRAALAAAGIRVRAAATGGNKGRTVYVQASTRRIFVKEPGGPEVELFAPAGAAAH